MSAGVITIVSFLMACMFLLNMVQKAFQREGAIWGALATLFPPGTYLFCRKNWDIYRTQFIVICLLFSISIISFVIMKLTFK